MLRSALASLALLTVAGCGTPPSAEVAADPGQERGLVNRLAAEDLDQFVVVDMADAVQRVSGVEVAAQQR